MDWLVKVTFLIDGLIGWLSIFRTARFYSVFQPQGLGSFRELGINGVEQGSRKHNYNHLINMSYGHRGENVLASGGRRSSGGYHGQSRQANYYYHPKYNKEQFLQAK